MTLAIQSGKLIGTHPFPAHVAGWKVGKAAAMTSFEVGNDDLSSPMPQRRWVLFLRDPQSVDGCCN
jgi:hypothetical protein